MLMARPPPHGSGRNGPLPPPITLPSFRQFCSITEQPEQAPQAPSSARLPPSVTEPAGYSQSRPLTTPTYPSTTHQQLPFSPPRSEVSRASFTQAPPLPSPHTPSQWKYAHTESVGLSSQHVRQPYSEPFSPPRAQIDVQQHAKVVVQESVVDGKGLCYIYSDGTICPKSINGDTVNPKWGTTKAGKPRKRLGQACNTCREKKIRCDPQVPKCAQCQKFGRDCKFETSARGTQRNGRDLSPEGSSPPVDRRESIQHDRPGTSESVEILHERMASRTSISELLSPQPQVDSSLQDLPSSKRRRFSTSPRSAEVLLQSPDNKTQRFGPAINPFLVDSAQAAYYLDAFMVHFNTNLQHIFPDYAFRRWAIGETPKSTADLLLLYAALALGTAFCSKRDTLRTRDHARAFVDAVDVALGQEASRPSIQLAQALLYMGFYRLTKAEVVAAREASAFALNVCLTIGINHERQQHGGPVQQSPCFGFDETMFDECRRRTFWVAYITDTMMLYCAGQDEAISDISCSLRVPCAERAYDEGSMPSQPIATFQGFEAQQIPFSPSMGLLAVFVEGYAILREALVWLGRFKRMSLSSAAEVQVDVKRKLLHRSEIFYDYICHVDPRKQMKAYTSQLKQEAADAMGHKQEPRQAFVLFHFIRMVLHRHMRHDCMTVTQISDSVNEARSEAFGLLNLLWKLRSNGEAMTPCPISGYAIFLAIDITTAGDSVASALEAHAGEERDDSRHERTGTGSRKAIAELLSSGIEILDLFSESWGTAKQQVDAAAQRFASARLEIQSKASRKPGYFFRKPLYSPFGEEVDVIYGLNKVAFFRALGMGDRIRSEADLYEAIG